MKSKYVFFVFMAVHTHHESTSQETSAWHTSASYKELQFLCFHLSPYNCLHLGVQAGVKKAVGPLIFLINSLPARRA